MGVERMSTSVYTQKVPEELREEIDTLKAFDSMYRVWGDYDGKGLVIRSEEPLDVRDILASSDVQRVVTLGKASHLVPGMSRDGFFPLHRMVRWAMTRLRGRTPGLRRNRSCPAEWCRSCG